MKLKNIFKGSIKNLDQWQIKYLRLAYQHKPCIFCNRIRVIHNIMIPDDLICRLYHNGIIERKKVEPLSTCYFWRPDKTYIRKYPKIVYEKNKNPFYNNAAGGR